MRNQIDPPYNRAPDPPTPMDPEQRFQLIGGSLLGTGILIGLYLLTGWTLRGCEICEASRIKESAIEHEAGIKVTIPVYIKGTNALAVERTPDR